MTKAFTPGITVPGAIRITDPATGMPAFFQKRNGRQIPAWSMPNPSGYALHFKSAGARRKFMRGEIGPEAAYNRVPIYRGVDSRLARQLQRTARYRSLMQKAARALRTGA